MKKCLLLLMSLAASTAAVAHTNLSSSIPEDGSQVQAPSEIQLVFSAPVRLTAVTLRSADGTDVALGDLPSDTQASFSIAINAELAAGHYQVSWRSISGDSHVVSGELRFTVTD